MTGRDVSGERNFPLHAGVQHQIAELQRVIQAQLPDMQAIAELQAVMHAQLPALQAIVEKGRLLADALPRAKMIELAAQATRVAEAWAETKVIAREFFPTLAEHGWLISPHWAAGAPRHLNDLYLDGGIEAVEHYLLSVMDADACSEIVGDLTRRRTFASWEPTFAKALDALNRGEHELAIPIWLAALDRACSDEGLTATGKTYSQFSKRKRRAIVERLQPKVSSVSEPLLHAWVDVLTGFSEDSNRAGPAILNRHAVMHGLRPDVGSRKDALQCLLALQVLAWLLDLRDRRLASPSKRP